MTWYTWEGDDLLLQVQVQPKAGQDEIAGVHAGRLKVKIKAPPVDGAANRQLIKFLSKIFKTPKSNIEILSGETGRAKRLRICSPKQWPALISKD
jgi:uncharacterized protein (TIGR00251 family)